MAPLLGAVEEATCPGMLRGWACRADRPGQAVRLEVLVDGEPIGTVTTGLPRPDLSARGLDGGRAGFALPLPAAPTLAARFELRIACAETGEALAGPLAVEAGRSPDLPGNLPAALVAGPDLPAVTILMVVAPGQDAAAFREGLRSLVLGTWGREVRLLLLEDGEAPPGLAGVLAEAAGRAGVTVVRNAGETGGAAALACGLALAGRDDVVVMEPGTRVAPRWLGQLRLALLADGRVGAVSPLVAGGGPLSVGGGIGEMPLAGLARLVERASADLLPDAPGPNGSCLYLRRSLLDSLGMPGADPAADLWATLGRFLVAAREAGWRHLACDRAVVLPARAAGDTPPGDPALGIVRRRIGQMREMARRGKGPRPRVLFVVPATTGGLVHTTLDLAGALEGEVEPWLLEGGPGRLRLLAMAGGRLAQVAAHGLAAPLDILAHGSAEYDAVATAWLARHGFDLVHVRHLAWQGLGLGRACAALGLPVVFSFHDYYVACPALKLVDERGRHCGGICTPGPGPCQPEPWGEEAGPGLKHRLVGPWRDRMAGFLAGCDAFVTTSESAKALLLRHFPGLAQARFPVIPHGRDLDAILPPPAPPGPGEPLRVLALGAIGPAKGSAMLAALVSLGLPGVEFHLLGAAHPPVPGIIDHGPYRRESLAAAVAAIRPHLGVQLAVWPETWSHVLTEYWACGLPVVCTDLGAPAERLRAEGGGWLCPPDAAPVGATLRRLRDDPAEIRARAAEVAAWQAGTGRRQTAGAMAAAYLALYRSVFAGRQSFRPRAPRPAVPVSPPGAG